MGYNSACTRVVYEILVYNRWLWGSKGQIGLNLRRMTLMAMATKFETKWEITPVCIRDVVKQQI